MRVEADIRERTALSVIVLMDGRVSIATVRTVIYLALSDGLTNNA